MIFIVIVSIVISIIAILRANDAQIKLGKLEILYREMKKKVDGTTHTVMAKHVPIETKEEVAVVENIPGRIPSDENEISISTSSSKKDAHQGEEYVSKKEYMEPAFITWLKEDWLLKFGGILVIMGVLFFLSLAYTNVGPLGKISIGYIFGATLMIFGFWYASRQLIGGSAIHLIGAVSIIITTYLAQQPDYNNLFGAPLAMMLMFLTTVCIALTAFAYERAPLAHVGLCLAGAVPLFTGTVNNGFTMLLVYLLVVIVGVLWLAFVTRWRTLIALSLIGFSGYSAVFITGGMGDAPMTSTQVLLVALFGAVFFLTSLFSIMRTNGETGKEDGLVALLNAGLAIMWVTGEATTELVPVIIALIGLIYAAGFFCVYKITNKHTSFIIYGGVALGMVATAVMFELEGKAETVTLLLMGAGATVFTYYLSKDEAVTKLIGLFNILPLLSVLQSIGAIERVHLFNRGMDTVWKDFLLVGIAIVVYLALYMYFAKVSKSLSRVALFTAIGLIIIETWQIMHLLTSDTFATSLSLLVIGVGLTVFAYFYSDKDEKVTSTVALVNVLTVVMALRSVAVIGDFIHRGRASPEIWKEWFFVIVVIGTAFTFYGCFLKRFATLAYVSLTVALTFVVTTVWQVLHASLDNGLATLISILIYTIVGLVMLYQGTQEKRETKIKLSRIFLGGVALRVILIDAWHTGDIAFGVFICIIIGVLLLSSTFIIKKVASGSVPA